MKLLYSVLGAASLVSALPSLRTAGHSAPIHISENAKEVPNSYIVVFKDHVKHTDAAAHHSWVQDIHLSSQNQRTELRKRSQFPLTTDVFEGLKHTYNIAGSLLGYSGHFDDEVLDQIRRHPDVS